MAERTVIGIDPGLGGALARLWPSEGRLQIADMPTLTITRGGKARRVIDEYAVARLVDEWASSASCVWLERVGVMPGEGGVGAFSFGQGYGLLRGICVANFLTINDVLPQVWKRALAVKGDKDEARMRASALFPRHSGCWPLKKHDGRAESALIALYGARQAERVAA